MLSMSLYYNTYTVADFLIGEHGVYMALAVCVCVSVCLYWTLVNPGCSYFAWFMTLGMPSSSFLLLLTVTDLHQHKTLHVILADVERRSCSADEENWSNNMGDSQEFVETPYIPGSLVWAKMDSYPW